jgi:hypothetical protein
MNPNGSAADAWFEYGTDPALPAWAATPRQANQPVSTPLSFRASVQGFSPYTTYYYRAVARNRFGTQRGDILAFPTGEYCVAVGDSITLAAGGRGFGTDVERSPQEFEEESHHRRELGCERRHLRSRSKIYFFDVVGGTKGEIFPDHVRDERCAPARTGTERKGEEASGPGISRIL